LEFSGKKPHETYRTKKNYRKQNSGSALEREISDYFSKAFTYKAFKIDYDRLTTCEGILIIAFSVYYQLRSLKNELDMGNWLGQYSYSQRNRIKRSGLWNSEGVLLANESSLSHGIIGRETISLARLNIVSEDLVRNII